MSVDSLRRGGDPVADPDPGAVAQLDRKAWWLSEVEPVLDLGVDRPCRPVRCRGDRDILTACGGGEVLAGEPAGEQGGVGGVDLAVGGELLLTELIDRAGVAWSPAGDGEHPALRLMVTAGELARAYLRLASDEKPSAVLVRQWMRQVPNGQTFDLRRIAAETIGCPEGSVGVKCGWFGLERAHAVVLAELGERTLGAAVTTTHRPDATNRAKAQALSGNESGLVLAHNLLAGDAIRDATRRALKRASEL